MDINQCVNDDLHDESYMPEVVENDSLCLIQEELTRVFNLVLQQLETNLKNQNFLFIHVNADE